MSVGRERKRERKGEASRSSKREVLKHKEGHGIEASQNRDVPLVLNQDEDRTGPSDLALAGVRDPGRKQHIPRVRACKDFLLGVTSGST